MAIFGRRDKYRRYGSKRMEYRRFGTPVKDSDVEEDADSAFLSRRLFVFRSVAAASFTGIAGRIGYLQLAQHHDGTTDSATQQTIRKQVVKAPRGLIVDRNGETVAENRKVFGLSLVRSKLPADLARREAMFVEVERYVPLLWAITVKPLGLKGLGTQSADLAKRLDQYSDFDAETLTALLTRTQNTDPILLAKDYTKQEIEQLRPVLGDVPGIRFLRHAEWLVSYYNQPDADRPTLVYRGLDKQVALALDANANDFPGMVVDESVLSRSYPAGELMAHILGYIGPVLDDDIVKDPATQEPNYQRDDLIGRAGIEAAMEGDLRGKAGTRFYFVDSQEVDRGTVRLLPAEPGAKMELTIDIGLQKATTDALKKQMQLAQNAAQEKDPGYEVHSAVAIMLDPRTGELLAMVSMPSYNNQILVDGRDTKAINAYLRDDKKKPMLNKAINEVYAPGSTLKPFFAAAGLQEGTLKTTTTYNCFGNLYVPESLDERARNPKPCWISKAGAGIHGPQNVIDAIANSCDIYFYNVGAPHQLDPNTGKYLHYYEYMPNKGEIRHDFEGLGIEKMDQYLSDFGFGAATGVTDLFGEAKGTVPSPDYKETITKSAKQPKGDPWSLGDTINVTIGQGYFTCTPMQMAVATAAIANDGAVVRPHVVRRVLDNDGNVLRTADTKPVRTVLTKPEHLAVVRQGMRKVITDGTAKDKFKLPVEIAGKTGTAEFGEYVKSTIKGQPLIYQHQHAWFTAFAPYVNPEVVVAVLIVGGGEGSTYAAPVANEMLAAYFSRKNK